MSASESLATVLGDDFEDVRSLDESGGFGGVWLARQRSLDRWVVLKVVHGHLLRGEHRDEVLRMIEEEAQIVAKLRHENIVRIYACRRDAVGNPHLMMEYVEGCDVDRLVKEVGPLPPNVVAYMAVEVAKALSEAHQPDPNMGRPALIHRDIKGKNIMFSNLGRVVVLDFGIAKLTDHTEGLAETSMLKATLPFASPEQLQVGTPFDRRVDLWALGVVIFFALTGRRPFEIEEHSPLGTRDRRTWLLQNIMNYRRPKLADLLPDIEPRFAPLVELVEDAIAPLEQRVATADEFVERLVHAGLGLPTERRALAALVSRVKPRGSATLPSRPGLSMSEALRSASEGASPQPEASPVTATTPLAEEVASAPSRSGMRPALATDEGRGGTVALPAPPGDRDRLLHRVLTALVVLAVLVALGLGAGAVLLMTPSPEPGGESDQAERTGERGVAVETEPAGAPAAPDLSGVAREPDPSGQREAAEAAASAGSDDDDESHGAAERPDEERASTDEPAAGGELQVASPDAPPPSSAAPAERCQLQVVIVPSGVASVRGAGRGPAPRTFDVPAGTHSVSAQTPHGQRDQRRVRCRPGERRQVTFDFLR